MKRNANQKMKFVSKKKFQKDEIKDVSSKKNDQQDEKVLEEEDTRNNLSSLLNSLKSNKQILRSLTTADEKKNYLRDLGDMEKIEETNIEMNCKEESSDVEEVSSDEEINSDEEEESDEESEGEDQQNVKDPFKIHFEQDLPEDCIDAIQNTENLFEKKVSKDSPLHECYNIPDNISLNIAHHLCNVTSTGHNCLKDTNIKETVAANWQSINKIKKKGKGCLTYVQKELFGPIASYKDLLFNNRTHQNAEEIRRLYCLHAVNHVLKTRTRILKNNARLTQAANDKQEIDDCRDQGLTRPKVLIIVPFRNSCLQIVNLIIKLAISQGTKGQIMQKKRFITEFSSDPEQSESKAHRPDDFKATFEGNIDDCFRIGVSFSKNTVKLFAPFYASDIIIASPLGLRTTTGTEGEKHDFDFLSSIEILIADQADVFLMQNWEHVQHIFEHLHCVPKQSHNTDFSRVRMWTVNQWSKYYRQTMVFSAIQSPEMNNIFNKHCYNFNGKVKLISKDISGSVEQVAYQTPQVYHRIPSLSFTDATEQRFQFFINKVLPDFKGQLSMSTAIFIPSYFDFVRVRNYFKKEALSFTQISEYSKRSNISRARSIFHEKKKQFMLFTERFNFFYRYRIRGIKHILFYELPHYPQFYSEIINFLDTPTDKTGVSNSESCNVLYSQFDGFKLEAIVGSQRCKQMLMSKKDVHMIVTGT